MYHGLYELLANAIFETTSLSGYEDLVITLISTFGVVFLVSIPFIIVFKIIKIITDC